MITATLTGNLGNNLSNLITSKCIAMDLGYEWGVDPSPKYDYYNGMIQSYFLDIDYGIFPKNIVNQYEEKCIRYNHGGDNTDIRIFDSNVYEIKDNTILTGGVWQSPKYFYSKLDLIKDWMKIKPEYIIEYEERLSKSGIELDENTCIMNWRGGEYKPNPRLILGMNYYKFCMDIMLNFNPNMKFVVITDDIQGANQFLPNIPAFHFDIGMDYYIINKCKYLILSNSSFSIFPALLNENVKEILAPKYWARWNVSNGYWALGDQYYPKFKYVNIDGKLESYENVKIQAEEWRLNNGFSI